jgi:TonB family protein
MMMPLLDSTLKVSLVIFAGLALAAACRHRSAALRHSIVAASIVCALAMPALELIVPSWGVALPRGAQATAPNASPVSTLRPAGTATPSFDESVSVAAPSHSRFTVRQLLAVAWMVGVGLSLFVLAVGVIRLTWLAWRARAVCGGPWVEQARVIERELGIRRPVRLLESDHASLLVTWGLWQPKVILPVAARTWSADRIAIVLRHELAHIRRGDWVVQIAGELLRTAYWFNPLLWVACDRLRQESEQACDDEVLSSGVAPPDYAAHLVDLARVLKSELAPAVPAPAIARSSSLERRVHAMLDTRLVRTPLNRMTRIITGAALLMFSVAVAAAQTGAVTFSGTVLDQTGAPVANVPVALTNTSTRAKHEVRSDANGKIEFIPLPADAYSFEVTSPGFKKAGGTVTLSGKRVTQDIKLNLGELQETVTIRGSANGSGEKPSTDEMKSSEFVATARTKFQETVEGCKPSTTGGRVRPPHKIKDVKPIYPANVQATGTVLLKAVIGVDGTVKDVEVVQSASAELDQAAVEAVRQWLFDGTLLNCQPTEVVMNVKLSFGVQ